MAINEIIKGMIDPYITGFDSYSINDEQLAGKISEFKSKLLKFAEENSDMTTFYQGFTDSGLQTEYMDLISKAAMAGMSAPQPTESSEPAQSTVSGNSPVVPSVEQFLEQYRTAYDEVKKAGYRKGGEAAYENIIAVKDRASDMLDAQIILEQERLLWKIVSEDSLDIFGTLYDAMDPLYYFMTAPMAMSVDAYKNADGDEKLSYLIEKNEYEKIVIVCRESIKIALAASLGAFLYNYSKKKQEVWEWASDTSAGGGVSVMVSAKVSIRRILSFMKTHYDMTFDDILNDQSMKLWLLVPGGVDNLSRIKVACHPQNYDAMRDVIYNEIIPDISVSDILKRKPDKLIWFGFEFDKQSNYYEKAKAKAEQLNSGLTYFKYLSQLENTSAVQSVKKDIESIENK